MEYYIEVFGFTFLFLASIVIILYCLSMKWETLYNMVSFVHIS